MHRMHTTRQILAVLLVAALTSTACATSTRMGSQHRTYTSLVRATGCSLDMATGMPKNLAIQLSLADDDTVTGPTNVCAGQEYKVKVELPDTSYVQVITSTGTLEGASTSCPRLVTSNTVRSLQTTLTLPCTAAGSLQIVAVVANDDGSSQNRLILPIDGSCLAASCISSQQTRKLLHGGEDHTSSTMDMGGESEEVHYRLMHAHGALMIAAVIASFPTGILLARHRRFLPAKKVLALDIWYWLHVGSQITGLLCFLAGVGIALDSFGDGSGEPQQWHAHRKIGLVVIAMICFQVLMPYIRPSPQARLRWIWNLIHHNWGRAAILLGWAEVCLGIWVYNDHVGEDNGLTPNQSKAYKRFVIATVILAFAVITAAVGLEVVSWRTPVAVAEQEVSECKAKHVGSTQAAMDDGVVELELGQQGCPNCKT